MDKHKLISHVRAATKKQICDLVIKNINIVDVFQNETFIGDVAVNDGYIIGIGEYEGNVVVDGAGKFICPGLIDAHAHIESSLVTPKEYYKAALLHGITSIIVDPHEIANVLGTKGIELMLKLSENTPLDYYYMLPSCVPATSFENSGAVLESEDLRPFYKDDKVLGLGEVMNYPDVLGCNEKMIDKLIDAIESGLVIDGHGAGLDENQLNGYIAAGISTDHECQNTQEVIDRLRRGMYVLMREGTVAKNLKELIKVASISNSRRICFCTDDKHIDDLLQVGSIDNSIRIAVESGLSAEIAVQMSTLNTAECYKIKSKGAIAPGFIADFIILDHLKEFKINSVYKGGKLVVKENKLLELTETNCELNLENSVRLPLLNIESFKIDLVDKSIINVMEIIPNKLESNHLKVKIEDLSELKNNSINKEKTSEFTPIVSRDLLKVAVIERHNLTGNIGLGVIKGLGLKSGAIATTVAHDCHNIIVCGTNDKDMLYAALELKKIGGGIIIVENEKVVASVRLEIGGLMTDRKVKEVIGDLDKLHTAIKVIAPNINFNPFLTLSFLSLPVIPDLKITDKGLFNVKEFKFLSASE
ncbi:MAG: adenine deaminase [Clostridiaceae bacterium]